MRQQGGAPGGHRPRLLFFLDEIGGGGGKTAFYPTYPYTSTCKPALNLLVKQARAFGVGCILATQNPGDIDYKGLSNCATWIVGKLQTKRDRDKVREGLTDAEFSPADLTKKLARPKTGEFMVLNKEGDVLFVKERWLLSYHCTLSPEQLKRYKAKGVAPLEGALDTVILLDDAGLHETTSEQDEIQDLWNDAQNTLGKACRLIEKIIDIEPDNSKARTWLNVLRDPEGVQRRLEQAQKEAQKKSEPSVNNQPAKKQDGLMTLLSQQQPQSNSTFIASSSPSTANETQPVTNQTSDMVSDDGSVTYKGKAYQLYRRYAGKAVTFIEENGELKFSIEGRVLSKNYRM